MTDEILLVLVGGLIGILGTISSVLLSAHFDKRRREHDERVALAGLMGERWAQGNLAGEDWSEDDFDRLQETAEYGVSSPERFGWVQAYLKTGNQRLFQERQRQEQLRREGERLARRVRQLEAILARAGVEAPGLPGDDPQTLGDDAS